MTFAPVSPLTVDGLPKFLSIAYHRLLDRATFTFAELGIADRLVNASPDQGLTAQEIIGNKRPEWNCDLLYRVLCACIDVGIVERVKTVIDDKHFVLTPSGMMLTSNHPSHARDLIRFYLGPTSNCAGYQLLNLVRGQCTGDGFAGIASGLDIITFLSQADNQDLRGLFNGAMTCFSTYTGDQLVTGVDFSRFKTIVDVGGNRGTFLAQILQCHQAIQHGFLLDIPSCIAVTRSGEEFESRKITKDRYSFVAGDMWDPSTIPEADAYVLKHILHGYKDEKAVAVLLSIRKANENRTGSPPTLFIVEHIIFSEGAISNWQAHAMDIAMTCHDDARERTEQEYQVLLEKAGFQLRKLYPIQAPNSIIEAVLVQ